MKNPQGNEGPQVEPLDMEDGEEEGLGPSGFNRRSFLARGGAAAAMLGIVASVPGGTAILNTIESDAPELDTGGAQAVDAGTPAMTGPVVAHVTDVSTGEISIYSGTQEVILRNPALAAQLVRASR